MKTIRILIAVLGMDQHEVGAVAVSRLLRDAGMEIIYLGRFNTPAGIVKTTIEENADIIGLSCLRALSGHVRAFYEYQGAA